MLREKRRYERDLRFTVENFYTAKKEEQNARERMRGSIQPLDRRGRYNDKERKALNKVKEIARNLHDLNLEYNTFLARFANAPEEYWQTSRCAEDEKGNLHVFLGVYDPAIGAKNHGHWIVNSKGKLIYARLPFESRGSHNFEDEIDVSEFWLKRDKDISDEQREEIAAILASFDETSLCPS